MMPDVAIAAQHFEVLLRDIFITIGNHLAGINNDGMIDFYNKERQKIPSPHE